MFVNIYRSYTSLLCVELILEASHFQHSLRLQFFYAVRCVLPGASYSISDRSPLAFTSLLSHLLTYLLTHLFTYIPSLFSPLSLIPLLLSFHSRYPHPCMHSSTSHEHRAGKRILEMTEARRVDRGSPEGWALRGQVWD
jgi:hypothetical protein